MKAVRDRRDIDQKDVAAAVGASPATVSRWEAGLVVPGDATIEKLARYFGVTPAWLRYGQEPRSPEPTSKVETGLPLYPMKPGIPERPSQPAEKHRRRGGS